MKMHGPGNIKNENRHLERIWSRWGYDPRIQLRDKNKVHVRTNHEDPEGIYSSTISLTSTLDELYTCIEYIWVAF
jgi:hypothetical protein